MQGTLLHHSAPMYHVKVRVPTILTTPKIGGVPHHALQQRMPWEGTCRILFKIPVSSVNEIVHCTLHLPET